MKLVDCEVNIRSSDIGDNCWIRLGSSIINSVLKQHIFVGFRCKVVNTNINSHVQIASNAIIGSENAKKVNIDSGVWIGAGVTIIPGVSIGEGAIIGAGSVVTENIEPYSIVVGNPAKKMKARICEKDEFPTFLDTLKEICKQEASGLGIHRNSTGNYITADIITNGNYTIGKDNILIGKKISGGGIYIGKNVLLGNDNIFEGFGSITIGDSTTIGNNTHFLSNGHDYTKLSMPRTSLPVVIGKNVKIGDNVTILGAISIPDNYVIEKNTMVLFSNHKIKEIRKVEK